VEGGKPEAMATRISTLIFLHNSFSGISIFRLYFCNTNIHIVL